MNMIKFYDVPWLEKKIRFPHGSIITRADVWRAITIFFIRYTLLGTYYLIKDFLWEEYLNKPIERDDLKEATP